MGESKRPALLVGSLNLADRDEVFDEVSRRLKDHVRSVPDGETGERGTWVAWAASRLAATPGLETVDVHVFESPVAGEVHVPVLAVAEGVDLASLELPPLSYVEEAETSYEQFKADRRAGHFDSEMRFQVSIPTPMMFAMLFLPQQRLAALAALERSLGRELDWLFEAIPSTDLAVQWDVAGETYAQDQFRYAEGEHGTQDKWPLTEVGESLSRVSVHIPPDAMLGIHFCYGDPDGEHVVQPRDLAVCVDLANSASELIERRLDWVHMPVPIDRDDAAYFAPLAGLRLRPETQLYLGLVHREDGVPGAKRRIEAAMQFDDSFGVATECGMGREPREAIASLLDLHREAASL